MAWPDSLITRAGDFVPGFVNSETMLQKVTDRLNLLVARVGDTGWITSGIFTGGTGVTIGAQTGRVIGNVAWVRVNYTVGGAFPGVPISPPPSGDVSNVVVVSIADSRFMTTASFADQSLTTSAVGRLAVHAVRTATNDVVLSAVAGTANIASGDAFTFSGSYLLD